MTEMHPKFNFEAFEQNTNQLEVTKPPSTLLERLEAAKIDLSKEVPKPQTCLSIGEQVIAILGDFSLLTGKAKSKKSFCVIIFLLAALINKIIQNTVRGNFPEGKRHVLYFDTEQSEYSVQLAVKRLCRMAGNEKPDNLEVYKMRNLSYEEMREMIKAKLYSTPGIGLVVIDGIKDLVSSINDEAQATMISRDLLKWTSELNIHIMVVLHQNKTDTSVRGHLGTELINKAMTVLSVTKDPSDNEITIVSPEYCRFRDPEPFAFIIDENGFPKIVEIPVKVTKQKNTVQSISDDNHKTTLRKIFKDYPNPNGTTIKTQLKTCFNIGDTVSRKYLNYYENSTGWIKFSGNKGSRNAHYELLV